MFSNLFQKKSCRVWDNVRKCGGARDAADDNKAHARCMLDNKAIRALAHAHALPLARADAHTEICSTFAFPRQKQFRERASVLRYTYISSLVISYLEAEHPNNMLKKNNCHYYSISFQIHHTCVINPSIHPKRQLLINS